MGPLASRAVFGLLGIIQLYLLCRFVLRPQLSFLRRSGWKQLAAAYAMPGAAPIPLPGVPMRVGWNKFTLRAACRPEGVYLQREGPPYFTLLIPYAAFRPLAHPLEAQAFAPDSYSFFTVDGIELWLAKQVGRCILAQQTV